jgi:hypothetical protein
MRGHQKLVSHWRADSLNLMSQRRTSTRLYETLAVLIFQIGR